MSRQRFIHPAIFTSEDFVSLSLAARLLWIGLFTLADDHGKGHAGAAALKTAVFPADAINREEMLGLRDEIQARGMIQVYEIEARSYYVIPKWKTYQRPTWCKPSIIPDPPKEANRSPIDHQPITDRSDITDPIGDQPAINRSPVGEKARAATESSQRSPTGDQPITNRSPIGAVDRIGSGWVGLDRVGLDREGKGRIGSGGDGAGRGGTGAIHGEALKQHLRAFTQKLNISQSEPGGSEAESHPVAAKPAGEP